MLTEKDLDQLFIKNKYIKDLPIEEFKKKRQENRRDYNLEMRFFFEDYIEFRKITLDIFKLENESDVINLFNTFNMIIKR